VLQAQTSNAADVGKISTGKTNMKTTRSDALTDATAQEKLQMTYQLKKEDDEPTAKVM
jgi:hypothetical protein